MTAAPLSLRASGRVRRRLVVNRVMEFLAMLAAALAIAVLVIVVVSVARKGASALNLDFFTKNESSNFLSAASGGVLFGIVGTLVLVAFATLIALPLGVLVALYMTEFARPLPARILRMALDVTNGVPSIVVGIFIFTLIVISSGQSALAGSVALAIIMLPLIARASQEVLLLVPRSLREASLALGVSRWRTVLSIVLPAARGGIITGTTLAVARAAGETAPLLFTSSLASSTTTDANPLHPLFSLTEVIFIYFDTGDPSKVAKAWGAAFLLMMFVLITSLSAKLLLARTRRKLGS
ncbi:MAG: phosphate ABC transporter permease PstA [Gaiellaceae bacterium]